MNQIYIETFYHSTNHNHNYYDNLCNNLWAILYCM